MACLKGCVNPELGKHHQKCPNYGRRCHPSGLPLDATHFSPYGAAEATREPVPDVQHQHEDGMIVPEAHSAEGALETACFNEESTLQHAAKPPNLENEMICRREELHTSPASCEELTLQQGAVPDLEREMMCRGEELRTFSDSNEESTLPGGAESNLESEIMCQREELRTSPDSKEEWTLQRGAEPNLESEMMCPEEELRTSPESPLQRGAEASWESDMMCRGEELHMSPNVKADRRAAAARVRGAAATLGGVAGVLVSGPVAGVAMAAAAAYTTTRENDAGRVLRKASTAYLQVTDEAVDMGLEVAHQVFDEGCKQLSKQLNNVNPSSVPVPLRAGILKSAAAVAADELEFEEAKRMRERFPDRVPVLCERSPYSDLPPVSKRKLAVPGNMLCGEFKYMVHKHVVQECSSRAEQTIYIFVNGIAPKTSTPMSELYAQLGPGAGFLHVSYSAENTLGGSASHLYPGVRIFRRCENIPMSWLSGTGPV